MKRHQIKFEFSPNLIVLLGEQLIHDKKIALSELVKNAYDADASEVKITVGEDEIIILDNGCGMDLHTIQNIWLKPGTSEKREQVQNKQLTEKYKRLPTGEKGIGRLGAHRLGGKIVLFSKKANSTGVYFEIDWKNIENANSLDDLQPIEVRETDGHLDLLQEYETGTYICIKELKEEWRANEFEDVGRDLSGLIAPFSDKEDFNIIFKFKGQLFDENLEQKAQAIRKKALYHFKVVFENGILKEFLYEFSPWLSLNKLSTRRVSKTENREILNKLIQSKKLNHISLEDKKKEEDFHGIGKVRFEGYIYDFDNILLKSEFTPQAKKEIKGYMKKSGGIRVYRDNFRVFNYGEEGFDILSLDLKRVNRPAGKISSNQIAASVQLKIGDSSSLIEKTNREGFIHNQAFRVLTETLDEAMLIISDLRQDDKVRITNVYLNKIDKADIDTKIGDIKTVIDESALEEKERDKIFQKLDDFSAHFSHLKQVLLTASNTGLNLTFIVHELEKIIDQLGNKLKAQDYLGAEVVFHHLRGILHSYKSTIRLDKRSSPILVSNLISQAISNFNFRLETHKIDVIQELDDALNVVCRTGLIIGVINNLFDNAVYWLKTYEIPNKKILIKSYREENFVCIVVADNGKGFTISFESALESFVSGRKEESSMGIGLHLADQIMIAHQGLIEQSSQEEEYLPSEFADGAIIKLKFRNMDK